MTTPFADCAVAPILLPGGGDIAAAGSEPAPQAVTHLAAAIAACAADVQTVAFSACELRDRLRALANVGARARSDVSPMLGVIDATQSEPAVRAAFDRDLPGRYDADTLANALIYDRYFHVERAPAMPRPQFVAHVVTAWAALFDDLPEAVLGRDEIAALLTGVRAACSWLGLEGDSAQIGSLPDATPESRETDVASRWLVGHHAFAIFAIVGRDAALRVAQSASSGDAATATAALRTTATLTRALTAAQWYASDFPFAIYRDVLRPTMEATGARGGFSGTQNADYARFKDARERAVEALFDRYGSDGGTWPPDVYAELGVLHEMEVQAAEHHVLVAASKVERDGSLAQKAAGDRESAVTALREIVDATIADIPDRFTGTPKRRAFACTIADVPHDRPLAVTVDGKELIVCRAYGAFWVCSGLCTHAQADLAHGHMAADCIVCPLHGSKFDPRTGATLHPPATQPLATYPVIEDGENLYITLD